MLLMTAVAALSFGQVSAVYADETVETVADGGDIFSDGSQEDGEEADAETAAESGEGINAFANELARKTTETVEKMMEEQEAAQQAKIEKKAADASEKAEADRLAALEEIEKTAEEAARKAEEARVAARQELVDFALQFEGNPYVYGGTSLTNGADCSGFVMSVFANFGYSLPRVAAAQCDASTKKDISQIEPGDLVFYGAGGINHVALYIGDGKIIHASTAATGIKISDYDYQQPAAIGTYMK